MCSLEETYTRVTACKKGWWEFDHADSWHCIWSVITPRWFLDKSKQKKDRLKNVKAVGNLTVGAVRICLNSTWKLIWKVSVMKGVRTERKMFIEVSTTLWGNQYRWYLYLCILSSCAHTHIFKTVFKPRVSQPWHYWYLEPDSPLLWGAAPFIAGGPAASMASGH